MVTTTQAAHLTGQHPVAANAVFGMIQLLLALGIARRPSARAALAASVAAMTWAAVLTTDRLTSLAPAPARGADHAGWTPRLAARCQVTMGIAMTCLLVQML